MKDELSNRKGPVLGAFLIVDDAPQLAMPVVAVPAIMPARARAKGYRRTVVVVIVATLAWIAVAATIVWARRAYANAHPAGVHGLKPDWPAFLDISSGIGRPMRTSMSTSFATAYAATGLHA